MVKKSRRGWIKVLEAFMAIVLLLGMLIIVVNNINETQDNTSIIEKNNIKILRNIEMNSTLRTEIINSGVPLNSSSESFPTQLDNYLNSNVLIGTNCTLYLCGLYSECFVDYTDTESYSSSVYVFSNQNTYNPREVKISCYKNEI